MGHTLTVDLLPRRAPGEAPALSLRHWSKRFGRSVVLNDVALDVMPGEVHGLLGQNGSGKSTLIKILAGLHEPEAGAQTLMYGEAATMPFTATIARQRGIAFVHQHLSLIPSLSVLENLRIGAFGARVDWRIDWSGERRSARQIFERFGLAIHPDRRIDALSHADRALVAIVRALEDIRTLSQRGRGVLVLDEPTPFLPKAGVEKLLSLVRQIVSEGVSVIFVSHDIAEIKAFTDRATVLRDGAVAGALISADASSEDFIELIVGRRMTHFRAAPKALDRAPIVAEVNGLSGGQAKDVSFAIRQGETLGLTGLIGSGFDEAPSLVYGARRAGGGVLTVEGTSFDLRLMNPAAAMKAGIAFLSADRLREAGVGSLSIADNISLPVLDAYVRGVIIHWASLFEATRAAGRHYDIRPNAPKRPLASLSGGNQQKALLAKWLQTAPKILLLDEPTQGVDVGARQNTFAALDAATTAGSSILCASTDYEQLAQICDRVIVFAAGRVVAELSGADLTKDRIAQVCLMSDGSPPQRAPLDRLAS